MYHARNDRAPVSDDLGNRAPTFTYRLAFASPASRKNFHGFGTHYDSLKAAREAAHSINATRVKEHKQPATHVMVLPSDAEYDVADSVDSNHARVRFELLETNGDLNSNGFSCG